MLDVEPYDPPHINISSFKRTCAYENLIISPTLPYFEEEPRGVQSGYRFGFFGISVSKI